MSRGSTPATRKVNGILGLSIASWFKGGDPYLILPGESTPEVLCPVLDCSVQETHEYTGKTTAKSWISKGQESWDTPTYVNTWREWEKQKHRLFPLLLSGRTRGSGHKQKLRSFFLISENSFFTGRMTSHWQRLPREVVESPCLEILSSQLDMVVGHWLYVALLEHRHWTWLSEVLSNLNHSMILCNSVKCVWSSLWNFIWQL